MKELCRTAKDGGLSGFRFSVNEQVRDLHQNQMQVKTCAKSKFSTRGEITNVL
jgi:hypothetical protein